MMVKPVPGYEGLYSAREDGRIYSHRTRCLLKPYVRPDGYVQTALRKLGKSKRLYIHRIMMCTFSNMSLDDYRQVDHIDGNKSNNSISNLRAVTQSENLLRHFRRLKLQEMR